METQITLSIAGIKINYHIHVQHLYDKDFSFYVTNDEKDIVLNGQYNQGHLLSYMQSKQIQLFHSVLDTKVQKAINTLAKSLKIKI